MLKNLPTRLKVPSVQASLSKLSDSSYMHWNVAALKGDTLTCAKLYISFTENASLLSNVLL